MKDWNLILYPVLLFLLIFSGVRLTRNRMTSSDYLSFDQASLIRGAACIGIIFHHLTQQITSYGIYRNVPVAVFNDVGFLLTSLFFFFSGYGLLTSLYAKPDYLHTFLQKRLLSVLIPFWVINFLGILLNIFGYGIHYTVREFVSDLTGFTLVNSNGWYIVEIVFLYLAFWILFRLIPKRDIALILLCLFTAAMIVYSFHQGHDPAGDKAHWFRGEWWYNSTITFIVGLVFARIRVHLQNAHPEGKQKQMTRVCYTVLLIISAVLSIVTLACSIYCVGRYGYYQTGASSFVRFSKTITLASQMAACVAFVLLISVLGLRIMIGNRVLRYISRLSRELFLVHGYFVNRIFGSVRMSSFLRFAVVLACSIACCAVLTPFINFLIRSVRSLPSHISARPRPRKIPVKLILIICVILAGIVFIGRDLRARMESKQEHQSLLQAQIGEEVLFGRYDTDPGRLGKERVSWILIGREEDRVCLLSAFGLTGNYYHQKHEPVSWEECDLRKYLNGKFYDDLFSRYEKQWMIPAETEEGEPEDLVTLLTAQQAGKVFQTDSDRILSITQSAWANGTNADGVSHSTVWYQRGYCNSWWWLRGMPGERSVTAPIVEMDGSIALDRKPVNKPRGAIRPVIWIGL